MDTQSSAQEPLVKKSNCWLQVRFQEKAIFIEDKNYFKLRVQVSTTQSPLPIIKLFKSNEDFVKLESIVKEQAAK